MAKKKPLRIIFNCKGNHFKFISFFVSKADNSIYFHLYRTSEEKMFVPKVDQSESNKLKFSRINTEAIDFDQNKISFHESGYVHTTDKLGKRFRDGKIGIPFEELINDYLLLLCLSPKNPLDMVPAKKIDNKRDFIIGFDPKTGPVLFHFWIKHKSCKKVPGELPGENMLGGFVEIEYDNKDFTILIAMTKLKTINEGNQKWPPFTLALNFVSNGNNRNLIRLVGKTF